MQYYLLKNKTWSNDNYDGDGTHHQSRSRTQTYNTHTSKSCLSFCISICMFTCSIIFCLCEGSICPLILKNFNMSTLTSQLNDMPDDDEEKLCLTILNECEKRFLMQTSLHNVTLSFALVKCEQWGCTLSCPAWRIISGYNTYDLDIFSH